MNGYTKSNMQQLRVLIIEDDGMISLLLTILLEEMGYEVCATAATEDEAVVAAAQTLPDLIIADVNLREGSGIGAMERIRRVRPVPHIFATADISSIRASRPDAMMIQKPYHYVELQNAINSALGLAISPS